MLSMEERDQRARESERFFIGLLLGVGVMAWPLLMLFMQLHHVILACAK